MKRPFLLILLLMTFGLSGIAQSGIYSGGVSQIVKHDLRKTGLIVRPELGFEIGDGAIMDGCFLSIGANVGYQISPHFYLGGGIGFSTNFANGYYYGGGLYYCIPLYSSIRWYWFDGVSSPFLELNTGLLSIVEYHRHNCFLLYPALGWDIKNVGIKVGFPCAMDNLYGCCITIDYNFVLKQKTKE